MYRANEDGASTAVAVSPVGWQGKALEAKIALRIYLVPTPLFLLLPTLTGHPTHYPRSRFRLQAHPRHLADLAGFLGLICTPENAENVFRMHTFANPPGDYTTYGLSTQTLEWMNTTMSKTLPEPMLIQYGLPPI